MPPEVRAHFTSDMRIVADFLAEDNSYRSDRPVRHKESLIKIICRTKKVFLNTKL